MTDSIAWLRTPAAIRERAEQMLKYVEDGRSGWFSVDPNGLEASVKATLPPSTVFANRMRCGMSVEVYPR